MFIKALKNLTQTVKDKDEINTFMSSLFVDRNAEVWTEENQTINESNKDTLILNDDLKYLLNLAFIAEHYQNNIKFTIPEKNTLKEFISDVSNFRQNNNEDLSTIDQLLKILQVRLNNYRELLSNEVFYYKLFVGSILLSCVTFNASNGFWQYIIDLTNSTPQFSQADDPSTSQLTQILQENTQLKEQLEQNVQTIAELNQQVNTLNNEIAKLREELDQNNKNRSANNPASKNSHVIVANSPILQNPTKSNDSPVTQQSPKKGMQRRNSM